MPLPLYSCPYHTKMNKSLVLEWPTFTDVYSFTVSYIGNPDVFDITRSPALYQFITTVSCPFEQTFQDGPHIFRPCFSCSGFVLSVLLLSSTPATVSPISPRIVPRFRVFIAKIRQVLTSLISPFALFSAFCVVVEFHSSHSFANFSLICSSFS